MRGTSLTWTVAVTGVLLASGLFGVSNAQVSGGDRPGPAPSKSAATPPSGSQPSTRPSAVPADQLLDKMLRPEEAAARPLVPQPEANPRDATSGKGATAPNAPAVPLLREGNFIVDRLGRLTRAGEAYEFVFEADGRTMRDPPMLILQNLKLQTMEDAVKSANRDLRFRVTGVITEYRGRNAVLIEKVIVVPNANSQN